MSKIFYINGKEYIFIKNLSNSKTENICLVKNLDTLYVYKELDSQIFDFELYSYKILKKLELNIPNLISIDKKNKVIISEYIQGENTEHLINTKKLEQGALMEIFAISELVNINNYNIDYQPSNFILKDKQLVYIKYAIYPYDELFNFHNYGVYFWIKNYMNENLKNISEKIQETVDEMYYEYITWKHSSRY